MAGAGVNCYVVELVLYVLHVLNLLSDRSHVAIASGSFVGIVLKLVFDCSLYVCSV